MCGISGIIGLPCGDSLHGTLLATMAHRGPDGEGIYQKEDCTLLHARLAVIDPEGGRQPMILRTEAETYVLIYNGELYNTSELRYELERMGCQFTGHSDTEAVLYAYARYGERCVDHINGIYAFAVWEERKKRLFLARDRIGVKPLFYMYHGGGFLFASEMKTILAYPGVRAELDDPGAAQLLMLGPGRFPGSGIFCGMYEVEPGCCGYWESGKLTIRRYWKLTDREHLDTFPETVEKVRTLVLDSIRRQMVSDVPLGTFLSGGLDSSLITAVCAEEMGKKGKRLKTFSVDYWGNDKNFVPGKFQPNADASYIALMEERLRTDHKLTMLSPEELIDCLEEATIARDLPGMADVDFSLLAFCRRIRIDVKVALSGECADEIFGGYPWYRDPEIRAREGFPWAQNTAQRMALLSPAVKTNGKELVMDAYTETCRESDILPGCDDVQRRMKEMVNLNFRWFMQTLLDRKDRMSMHSSLEVRVPFCDYRIAEYMYSVPWEYKDYQGKEKGLLRHAMEGILPEEVLWRKKSPYPKTFDPRYTRIVEQKLRDLLAQPDAPLFALVRKAEVEKMMEKDAQWPWYGQLMTRPQTLAYLLQLDFWLRHYQVQLRF